MEFSPPIDEYPPKAPPGQIPVSGLVLLVSYVQILLWAQPSYLELSMPMFDRLGARNA
jgi:hypothetical protein